MVECDGLPTFRHDSEQPQLLRWLIAARASRRQNLAIFNYSHLEKLYLETMAA
jgi:hypothetical protein